MKYFVLFILVFGGRLCFGQGVRFQLYRTGPCTTIEQLDTSYALYQVPYIIDTNFFPKKGIVYLPHIGKYKIYFVDGPFADTTIDITDTGSFIFRYREPDVVLYGGGLDQPPVYKACRKRINGYFEAFYPNGKIMMRGDFVNGYPKDSLITWYAKGGLKSRKKMYKKETDLEEFDSLSRRVNITRFQNGSVTTYRWEKYTEFFANGGIKLKESDVSRITRIREYYPNGQIKIKQTTRRRIEYTPDGFKKVLFRWRKKLELFEPKEKGIHDYTVYEKNYDGNGKISQIAIYEVWLNSASPPTLDINKADWIINLKKFKDGKEIYNVSDIAVKDYKK